MSCSDTKTKMMIKWVFQDGNTEQRDVQVVNGELLIERCKVPPKVKYIELLSENFTTEVRDEGYFVIPNLKDANLENNGHSALISFRDRPDIETVFPDNTMPIYGICHNHSAILTVVCGMALNYSLVCGVKKGRYYLYPRFILNGEIPYEDIVIKNFELSGKDATYSGIARRYRKYQLERGACLPLRERMIKYPAIGEATLGPAVRLRMAWKPVPPPVLEQTEENEPPMHVAITFERAEAIIKEFHQQGIENAEFCLVGWNKSGHDGRFPDLFPVEPQLGGEKKLKKLIKKARDYGYLICAHTNLLDSYSIAKRWKREYVIEDKDGHMLKGGCWGGGQSYLLCPKMAYEKYAVKDFDDMAKLGFYGAHYLDVMSILRPDRCYNKEHPLNIKEAGEWRGQILALARNKIGASASEGSWDFCIGDLDYVLYTIFHPHAKLPDICDSVIPLWHLVYHGIILYNTSCDTVNTAVKDRKTWLENVEYGGRPMVYFCSRFIPDNPWLGKTDCTCATDAELRTCVGKIKKEFDEYKSIRDLQFEFMEDHRKLAPGVFQISYSNGSLMIVNYNNLPYEYAKGQNVPPCDFIVINREISSTLTSELAEK